MSKIGRVPVTIPNGINVSFPEPTTLVVKGPKGELKQTVHPLVKINVAENKITVENVNQTKFSRSLHGTYQRLVQNMVTGVETGYKKTLELVGTGYRVQKQGNKISLSLGLSHPVEYQPPAGVQINVEGNNKIIVEGIDKQLVGQVAAEIRSYRRPEPYKGKGIRYEGEVVRRKAGKAAKAG